QSSIRGRIIDYRQENNIHDDILSIEYIPKTGKFKGKMYEQFYKDDACNLFVWLKDTTEYIDGELYKKDLQGTYWDMNGFMKNLTKEGSVLFPKGKKPEQLISQILSIASDPGDFVLDSFLGSGTTAVAHKMGRRWIGIEMGDQAYTHCKVRLDTVIKGDDNGGITKSVDWQGGGGYNFYELAPTLINVDAFGEPVINKEYSADMLAAAIALHEGFTYHPNKDVFWKQSFANEKSYLFVTTQHITAGYLDSIQNSMCEDEYLILACRSFDANVGKVYHNITLKKIPQMLLAKCEFGKSDYNLNIVNPPIYEEDEDEENE
ncbi:MAG: DNA methyltransferase, partial [Coprobacillus sp.]